MATIAFKREGDIIWLIGKPDGTLGSHLGQSLWLREIHAREEGPAPVVDLDLELRNGEMVRQLISDRQATAVHDIADGGLLVALAEMAMASGLGAKLEGDMTAAEAFGEDQSRYIVTTRPDILLEGAVKLGTVGGSTLASVPVAKLKEANEAYFKGWMDT